MNKMGTHGRNFLQLQLYQHSIDLMYFVLHAVRTYDATANFDLG